MYYSKIKEEFRDEKFSDKYYVVLFDIGDEKVLTYDPESRLIYDLYKNKLEEPQKRISFESFKESYDLILEAKKDQYVKEYNLDGDFMINFYVIKKSRNRRAPVMYYNKLPNLNVSRIGEEESRFVFPSRFKVKSLKDKNGVEVGEYDGKDE